LADGIGQVLVVPVLHDRLVIVEVHLRRPADHVQVDDVLGLGGVMRADRRGALGAAGFFLTEERRQRPHANGVPAGAGEVPAGEVQAKVMEWMHGVTPVGDSRSECATILSTRSASRYLFNTSSKFIIWFTSIVHAASVAASSVASGFDSPTAMSFFASSGF